MVMNVQIPENVKYIIETLENNGHEGYAVGGCVRDAVLGREPEDWDITTSAKPQQVKTLFRRTIDTGIKHGTVTVMIGNEGYEITTYRMDGEYEDHRHPSSVTFTPDLREDLRRRDFTINAMAYNPGTGIVDEFGGLADLERKCIRCVGCAGERFEEDALRMLRGIRFAGQLQFEIEPETREAIRERASTLTKVSAERIRTELTKLICSAGADRLLMAAETGLSRYFLPELTEMLAMPQNNPHHCFDVGNHAIQTIMRINEIACQRPELTGKDRVALAYAALLHDVAKPECHTRDEDGIDHFYHHNERGSEKAKEILRRLKFDNETIHTVSTIIAFHDRRHENCLIHGEYSPKGKKAMRRLINRVGMDTMPLLFILQKADLLAQSDYRRSEKLAKLEAGVRCFQEIREAGEAVTLRDLCIGGRDIMALGVNPGPEIGRILKMLLEQVLEEPERNTKEFLLKRAEEMYRDKGE